VACDEQKKFVKTSSVLDVEQNIDKKLLLNNGFEYVKEDMILLSKSYGDTSLTYGFYRTDITEYSKPFSRVLSYKTTTNIGEVTNAFKDVGGVVIDIEEYNDGYYQFNVVDTIDNDTFYCSIQDGEEIGIRYYYN
jgi:hypothetical protein